jgi:universal stress protein E
MKSIRRILVGVKDPAARSSPAVHKAACVAEAFGAELVLFHAIAVPVTAEPYLHQDGGPDRFEQELRQSHLDRLERRAARLRNGNGNGKLKVRADADWDYPVHEAIVRHARKIKADLVVAEAHAGRRLLPWLLHLTDWELLRTCPVPVLIVKSSRKWQRPRVLAAIDPLHAFAKPAGLDAEILDAGAKLSAALKGRLHAMHAYVQVPHQTTQIIGVSSSVAAKIAAASQAQARQAFDRALQKTRIPRSRRHLRLGPAADAIPRTARALRAGIVVMGAVSRSALKRVIIGNTAERILGDLPCDVLVVKPARFVTRVSRTRRGVRYAVSTDVPMPY